MVEYHVHHDLDVLFVRLLYHRAILLVGAQPRVDEIEVGNRIAVRRSAPVVLDGIQPYRSDSEFVNVVEMVDDALDVPSVAAVACPVDLIAVQHVIVRIAVGETVGHDEVEHVGRTEAHRAGLRVARTQFEGDILAFTAFGESEVQGSGLRGAIDVKIHEKIVGVLDLADLLDAYPFIICEAHR